jgi:hypothetical protein
LSASHRKGAEPHEQPSIARSISSVFAMKRSCRGVETPTKKESLEPGRREV